MTVLSFIPRVPFTKRIVLVDGFARTGKHLHNPIITSFERVQPWQLTHLIDSIPYLLKLKKIDREFAFETLKREVDHIHLCGHLSRYMNFRASDYSSVWHSSDPQLYFQQLYDNRAEGEVADAIIKDEYKRVFHLATHDTLATGEIDLFIDAWPNLKILNCRRNPIDVIYSANQKGWPDRMGTDPKSFWFAFKTENCDGPLPWWAIDWADEYMKMPRYDRLIRALSICFSNEEKTKARIKLEKNFQVQNIFFERACFSPFDYLSELEDILPTCRSNRTFSILEKQRLPRPLLKQDYIQKRDEIRKQCSEDSFKLLIDLVERFESLYFQSYASYSYDLRK